MKVSLRKIASVDALTGDVVTIPVQTEFVGELLGPVMCGLPLMVAHWKKGGGESCGLVSTTAVVEAGNHLVRTTDALYALHSLDAEAAQGRKRIAALCPRRDRETIRVPLRWGDETALKDRVAQAFADAYVLRLEDTPFGKATGYIESISAGVQRALVELSSVEDLEGVEARMRLHQQLLSDGALRFWRSLADVDLRQEILFMTSEVRMASGDVVFEVRQFVTIIEPDEGRAMHLAATEFSLPRNFCVEWQRFFTRVQAARQRMGRD